MVVLGHDIYSDKSEFHTFFMFPNQKAISDTWIYKCSKLLLKVFLKGPNIIVPSLCAQNQ